MTQQTNAAEAPETSPPTGAAAPQGLSAEAGMEPGTVSTVLRWAVIGLAALLVILGLLWAAQTIARHEASATLRNSVGVVDIDQALAAHRANYLEMVSKESATDEQREQATAYVKASTELINGALTIIAQECGCVLLIKPAVLQHQQVGLVDYTARLLELTKANSSKAR